MSIRIATGLMISLLSFSVLAKTPNPLCASETGSNFTHGNGTLGNPYLICNASQLASIGTNPSLLNQSFILGADLDYSSTPFVMIGAQNSPFLGTFNGKGYKLSSITLNLNSKESYLAIFRSISNATIKNLLIDKITLGGQPFNYVGGLIASADHSTITNIKITNLNMLFTSIYAGGLVGSATDSTISNVSTQGTMKHFFGTKNAGGIVGLAMNSEISSCASHVNDILFTVYDFGVDGVGGVVGELSSSVMDDCYADGNIDYSIATPAGLRGHLVGGVVGEAGGSTINNSYYAGKLIIHDIDFLGGAVGNNYSGSSTANGLFWDTAVSGINTSALGVGKSTVLMKQSSFWISQGYDSSIWVLANGAYPKLVSEG